MAYETLESLKSLTLNQVERFNQLGVISDTLYWEYYHEWKFGTFRYAEHPACFCEKCRIKRGGA